MMKTLVFIFALLLPYSAANAVTVSGSLNGTITGADAGNAFGLSVGDMITLDVLYDDSVITGIGGESVFFNAITGNTMDFTVGSMNFDESQDTAGGLGPSLFFLNGDLQEITFSTTFGSGTPSDVFFSFITFFEGNSNGFIGGEWDLSSYSVSPVVIPVPAAIWLFGSGIGLLWLVKRKRLITE